MAAPPYSESHSSIAIGIDLGGTKIEVIALERKTRAELYRHRIPSPQNDYERTIASLCGLVNQAESSLGISHASVGVAIPGSLSGPQQIVKNANSTWINGQPFLCDMQQALGRDVRMANDANCFAVSEAVDGAGRGYDCVFGVILGTGCGGGITIHGQLLEGAHGLGGEWGHNPLPFPLVYSSSLPGSFEYFDRVGRQTPSSTYQNQTFPLYTASSQAASEYPGPLCYCGKRGCIETWISGTGFQYDYQRATGRALLAEDIVAQAGAGDRESVAALSRYRDRLAKSLAQVINVVDPDIIVLGGGMSNVSVLYEDLSQRWQPYVFTHDCFTPVVSAAHGDSSGVRGAAWLWGV